MFSFRDPDGHERTMGNNEPASIRCLATYGDNEDETLLSDAQIDAMIAEQAHPIRDRFAPCLPPCHDQDGVGQCNAEAGVGAVEYARALQGLPYVKLSAADLYARINGGRDQGSTLEDGLEELKTGGVGTAEHCGTLWKSNQYKPAPREERRKYRALEYALAPTSRHARSCLARRRPLIIGIRWYEGYRVRDDGVLTGATGRYGGHAMMSFALVKNQGEYFYATLQSWGRYGPNGDGIFLIPEKFCYPTVGGFWTLRSVTDEGGVLPVPE